MSGLPCPLRLATRPVAPPLRPVLRLPEKSGPFGSFDTFGWTWGPELSIDENLLRLALVVRFNCLRVANYTSGRCSAIMARPPRQVNETHIDIEVVGFGINAPPRFSPRRGLQDTKVPGVRHWHQGMANNEIHSEMQIIGRCAREGIPVRGAWFYIALAPCWDCCKALVAAGAARVLFKGRGRRAPKKTKANPREQLFAEANGMAWVHADFCPDREDYVDAAWEAYKKELGLDRAAVKAQASAGGLWDKIKLPVYAGLWYFFNVQYNIENKKLLNVFHANWAVSWVQLAAGIPIALFMWSTGLVKAPKMTGSDYAKLAPVGAAFAAGQVATVASLGAVAVSFTHVVKALEPAVNAIASALVLGQVFHPMVYASLLPVFAGVALASSKELSFTMFGFLTAMASNFFFVTRNVLATKFGDVGDMGEDKTQRKTNQLAVLTFVATMVLLPVCLFLPGGLLSIPSAWNAGPSENEASE
ncbi:Phosphoenolpyruvate/phosphate translocator 2, chloroplastic [Symbiodinium microadriaticum]|uniref:Phosphoenolpyruvate/phosphate translocator 2, chloroplastic n=1 Tax=Symbiodinium microadriaticum TaxID=2951 RepID=A0A1Q9EPU9_SYMMI|nr:Phosphoenolpyruvate/phosphate translocator 2, chloroplastic [Symbiodinium microadriaticum]